MEGVAVPFSILESMECEMPAIFAKVPDAMPAAVRKA